MRSFAERRVDGIVVTASRVGALYAPLLSEMKVPIVLINNQNPGEFVHSVMIENVEASREATNHLIGLGHRRIAYLGDRFGYQSDTERFAGYRRALDEAGLPFLPELVVHGDGQAEAAMGAMDKLLALDNPPAAVFCYNDMSALGALRSIRLHGLRVPEDISLVGFDDLFLASYLQPPLTSNGPACHGESAQADVGRKLGCRDQDSGGADCAGVDGEGGGGRESGAGVGESGSQGVWEPGTRRIELKSDLLIPVKSGGMRVETEEAGFDYLKFEASSLAAGESFSGETKGNELGIVALGGRFSAKTSQGNWDSVGERPNVFSGLPWALYLPIGTKFTVTAITACDLAFCYCRAEDFYPACVITPSDNKVEIRGGGNATRQINHFLRPDFPAHRLLLCEVYTPSGNWSSYPPHKHDVHNPPGEVDLEEIYYYRIDRPEGYAIQRVYTKDRRLDETIAVRDGELVLIPEGYHPVVAAHGYNVYYLNALAGSARSMAASDDPDYAWVRQGWADQDPRLPMVR